MADQTREEAFLSFWKQHQESGHTFDASHLTRGGGLPDVNKLDDLGKLIRPARSENDFAVYEDNKNQIYVVKMIWGKPIAAEVSRNMKHWDTGFRTPKESSTDFKNQLIRLGSQKPELQKHIRPVLDVTNKKAVKGSLSDILKTEKNEWFTSLIKQVTHKLSKESPVDSVRHVTHNKLVVTSVDGFYTNITIDLHKLDKELEGLIYVTYSGDFNNSKDKYNLEISKDALSSAIKRNVLQVFSL